jgi:mannose-6-phosphate isomerase-like protein (cupin superfamily)
MLDDDTISRSTHRYSYDFPKIDIEFDEHAQFHVRPIKASVDDSTEREPPHRHNFQEIIWINSGRGEQAIDNQILRISPRTFYLIAQGRIHKFIKGHDLIGLVIQFTNSFLLDLPVDQTWIVRTSLFNNLAEEHTISAQHMHIYPFLFAAF